MIKPEVQKKVQEVKENNHSIKWITRLGFFTIFAVTVLFGWFFYEAFFAPKVLTVKNAPVPLTDNTVGQGQAIGYTLDYCKTRDMPSIIAIDFIDGTLVSTFNTGAHFPVGCHKVTAYVTVPRDINPDTYKLGVHVSYNLGVFGVEDHYFESQKFEVQSVGRN